MNKIYIVEDLKTHEKFSIKAADEQNAEINVEASRSLVPVVPPGQSPLYQISSSTYHTREFQDGVDGNIVRSLGDDTEVEINAKVYNVNPVVARKIT